MFCLRSWIPLLIFLTNTSPLYVLLFLTATYALQRPCVYCSILLFVLVFAFFDFRSSWFEPRWSASTQALSESYSEGIASYLQGANSTLAEAVLETASAAVSGMDGTAGGIASAAIDGARRRMLGDDLDASATINGFEWLRGLLEKRSFRIPCVDVTVRL